MHHHHQSQNSTLSSFMGLNMMSFQQQHTQQIEAAPPVVYVQQQNALGKFIPNLILRKQLEHKTDHDGNTLLHHMCSYNSPYLSIFIDSLPHDHAYFNQANFNGIRVLDLAATYCPKHIFEKLKLKGANGSTLGTDYWAIRGANLDCWSGTVPVETKELIHWAAYNDLPQVLREYQMQGANLNLPDNNGTTPIDTALINKSYKSFEYLLSLGFSLSNEEKLKDVDSFSMSRMYKEQKYGKSKLSVDPFVILLLILGSWYFLIPEYFYFPLAIFPLYVLGRCIKIQPYVNFNDQRIYSFRSKFFNNDFHSGKSQLIYILFLSLLLFFNSTILLSATTTSYFSALLYLFLIVVEFFTLTGLYTQLYGIASNLTNKEMFSANECEYLFKPISVVASRKLAVHVYKNPNDFGICKNLGKYFGGN